MMKKMKRMLKTIGCMLLVLTLVAGYVPMQIAADTNTSTGVKYVYDKDNPSKRVGIESVVIDDVTYYDIFGGSKDDRVAENRELDFLTAVLNSKKGTQGSIRDYWANLAFAVFADRSSYSSIINASGGFQKNFTSDNAGYADLANALAGNSYTKGSKKNDYTHATGLSYTNKLGNLRTIMADSIASGINRDVSGSDILNNTDGDNTLAALKNEAETDVLYSLVTAIDRSGKTFKYTYNSYGLAFYDFQLAAIADDDLAYVTAAEGYSTLEAAKAANAAGVEYSSSGKNNNVISYYENNSKEESEVSMQFTQSNSVTMSNTMENTETYSFSEMIGSATEIKGSIPLLGDVKETITLEFETEQVISTAYSETKSQTKQTDNTVTSTLTLPPQTAVAMESSDSSTSVVLDYDCPIAVTFKVAMFSLSGNVYDDSAAVLAFDTAGYKQAHFSTIFGSNSATGGTTARENLYNRAILYKDVNNFEQTYGQVYGWREKQGDGNSASTTNSLNWDNILGGTIKEEEILPDKTTIYINCIEVDADGKIVGMGTPFHSYTNEGYVDYDTQVSSLNTISENGYVYTLYIGSVMVDENNQNEDLVNTNGNYSKAITPIADEKIDIVNFYYTKETEQTASAGAKSTPVMNNLQANTVFAASTATNAVADKVVWLSTHVPMSVTGGTITTEAKSMYSNIYAIQPMYPLDYVKVTSSQKTFDMMAGDVLNMDTIIVDGYNSDDVHYYGFDQAKGYWVLTDAAGRELGASNIAVIEKDTNTGVSTLTAGTTAGTVYAKYKINEDCYGYMQNENKHATNNGLTSTAMVKINVSTKPFEGTVTTSGDLKVRVGELVNLTSNDDLKAYAMDESGKKISNAAIIWEAQLDGEDGIQLENNELLISKPGIFKVRATYGEKYSDWIEVTAVALKTLTIADEKDVLATRIIGDVEGKNISFEDLAISGKDQYGDEWDLSNDSVIWLVDGQPVSSPYDTSMLTAGDRKISAKVTITDGNGSHDVISNELTLTMLEARKLNELTIESTLEKENLAVGESYNLSKVTISGKDQYGDDYTLGVNDVMTWSTSGKYSVIDSNQSSVGGLVVGNDTLTLEIGNVKSNVIPFKVYAKPYAKELYTTSTPDIIEGVEYTVTEITEFTARDQYGESYKLSQSEIESLAWVLTNQGTIPSDKVTFDPQTKKLTVAEGSVKNGETGNVILSAVLTNKDGSKSEACYVTINVRQKAIIDQIVLKKKENAPVIRSSENAYLDEVFTYEVLDQYGKAIDTTGMTFSWASDNENAYKVDDATGIITAGTHSKSANITLTATDSEGRVIISNTVKLTVPRVRTLEGIDIKSVPEALGYNSTYALSGLNVICLDDYNEAFTKDELKAYPASIAFTFDPGTTDTRLDTAKNVLTTGSKYGYITITAMAVNSSSNTIVNEDGKNVVKKVRIWVGPYVTAIDESVDTMEYTGGVSTITLKGQYLVNGMTIGLFDSNGKLVESKKTTGNDKEQKVDVTLPVNNSAEADAVYTVRYSLDGTTYAEQPSGKVTVNKKRPVIGIILDQTSLVLRPNKSVALTATLDPSNTTDAIYWTSSNPAVATVDSKGKVKAVDSGKAVITVTAESGVSASCSVVVGLSKGDKYSKGIYTYKVTNDRVDGQGTMTVTGFRKGKSTKNVKIASTVNYNGISYKVTEIGNKAFYKNNKIKTVNTGKNVKTIGVRAFRDCKQLQTVVVGEGAVTIKKFAFYNCPKMTKLTLGKNVKTLESHSFCQNVKLKKIVVKSTKLKTLGKPHVFINVKKATISVPAKKLNQYKKLFKKYGLKNSTFKKLK